MDLISLFFGFTQLAEGFPATILGLREVRADQKEERSHPLATATYLDFQDAAVRMVSHIQLLAALGVPPSLHGALWSWPQAVRSHRAIIAEGQELTVQFGRLRMLGSSDVADAAFEVALAIGEALRSFPNHRGPSVADPEFGEQVAAALTALSAYGAVCRREVVGEPGDDSAEDDG
ncbi:MAG: hypothetical protein M3256_07045 [Actinomycetota bacterium]|nr:hypothetical protein [Actinomycetota bacterium]